MTNTKKIQGLWPALFTPVTADGKVNINELEKLVELQVKENVDGLYLLGSTGQGFLFSGDDRMLIARSVIEMVNKRLPVMVQVGSLSTAESIKLAKQAYASGADAISSVGPIYYGASAEMAYQHYVGIAQATDLPFFPYQIGKAASADLIKRLLAVENIGGMKLTTVNLLEISSIHQLCGDNWKLFSGADELMCHAAMCGTAGAIGTTYNLLGKTCKNVRTQFLNGKVDMGINFMLALQNLIEEVLPFIWSFFRKAMQLKHQIDIGDPLPPLLSAHVPLSDNEIMDKINHLEKIASSVQTSEPVLK